MTNASLKSGSSSVKAKLRVTLHHDEIASRAGSVFAKAGGVNHFQARSIALTAKYAVGSKNHKLCTLQPRISNMDSDSWRWVFNFVIAYLKRYKMQSTIDAIKYELGNRPFPEHRHAFKPERVDRYFVELLKVLSVLKQRDFDSSVMRFMEDMKYEDTLQLSPLINSLRSGEVHPTKKEKTSNSRVPKSK